MERPVSRSLKLPFGELCLQISKLGTDWHILLWGGDTPHIGCTVLATPRPSLLDPHKISATSSVLNITGHKDDILCRLIAEQVCRSVNAVTVCTGGFHLDHISPQQIQQLLDAVPPFLDSILSQMPI
ncbi:MAG: hypothetical protein ACOX6P_03820 [Candidatus Merdivicinus sp.]|jgi:hypothetical protein